MSGRDGLRAPDPVDEMVAVLNETLRANALRVTTERGGYVGGGNPHPTVPSDDGAVEAIARGLLARRVAEPSRAALDAVPVQPETDRAHDYRPDPRREGMADGGPCYFIGCGEPYEAEVHERYRLRAAAPPAHPDGGIDVAERIYERMDAYREQQAAKGRPVRPGWWLALVEVIVDERYRAAAYDQESGQDHEHYWTDARDDETAWHCSICGLTEYPETPPYGAEP